VGALIECCFIICIVDIYFTIQVYIKGLIMVKASKVVKASKAEVNPQLKLPKASLAFCIIHARAHAALTRRLDNALSGLHGLSFGDFMVLYFLERAPANQLRRIDLAERLGVTASGVTRTLLPMEKIGLVTRQADPRDARVGFATLTDTGRTLFKDALVCVESVAKEATYAVTDEQLAAMSAILSGLAGINLSNN
jgi:DNA-binding MarR family transcriptional regulator